MLTSIIIILVLLFFSAYFSGMEIAYVSSNKVQLEIEKKQGGVIGSILEKLTRKPSKFIATMLVGNNVTLVIYGIEMGKLILSYLPEYFHGILWQTIISTLVIVITGEFLPKVFFQIYSNTLLRALSPVTYVLYLIFSPITAFVIWLSDNILHVFFNTQGDVTRLTFSKEELENYISEQIENMSEDKTMDSEVQIFQNALGFSQVKARDIMKPRTEIIAISIQESVACLRDLFVRSNYSKILVYQENIDDIIGYVHGFDLFKKPKTIREFLRPITFVPETIYISKLLDTLTKKHQSMAIVFDEYGGTSGLVTLEDIVEELFGEIEDEHDQIHTKELPISDKEYVFSARLEVEYLNEKYKLALPESENYDTLGGLVMDVHESIPERNEEIEIDRFRFLVEEVSDNRIITVRVFIND